MAFANRLTTLTREKYMPKVVDTVLGSNVLASRILGKAKKWSGEKMKFPVKVSSNSTGTSFSGFDTFSTNASDTRVMLEFNPKFYQITVALPLDELSVNATDEKVLDLARVEMASSAQDMADGIGTLFYGDGTGNGSKDFLGLEAIVDDGNEVATYGGQARATYSTLAATNTGSGGSLSLAKMSTLYNAISSGSQAPTLGVTTEAVWALYEQLLQPQEQIVKTIPMIKGGRGLNDTSGFTGGTGFTALFYKGMPIVADEKCTAQTLYFLNEDFLNFYALPVAMTEPVNYKTQDIEGNDYSEVKGLGFSWSNWIKPSNQAAVVSHIYLGGELISENPKRHGKLESITSV